MTNFPQLMVLLILVLILMININREWTDNNDLRLIVIDIREWIYM